MRYGCLLTLPFLAGAGYADPVISADTMAWELSRGRVVEQGQTTALPQGVQTQGIIIEARAKAYDGRFIPNGTLRLHLSTFTPIVELPGQKVGYTYVQGKWTVTDQASTGDSRHSPGVVSGMLNAELDFDPAADATAWSAKAVLPMSTVTPVGTEGIQWARGKGQLNLSADLAGALELAVEVWPVATAGK